MVVFSTRRFQQLAELLQRIQGEIEGEGGELAATVEEGLDAAAREAGLDLQVARLIDAATLEALLTGGAHPDEGRVWAVAEVLYLDGLRARKQGMEDDSRRLLEKAAVLYGHVGDDLALPAGSPGPGERLLRIRELAEGRSS